MGKKARANSFLHYVQHQSASRFEAKELAKHKIATLGPEEVEEVEFEALINIVHK